LKKLIKIVLGLSGFIAYDGIPTYTAPKVELKVKVTKFLCHVAFKPFTYPEKKIEAPSLADPVAYGKYIVQDMVGCFGCHSADFKTLNELEPEKSGGYLGGGNPMTGLDGKALYHKYGCTSCHGESGP
jgi:mono/diheme cytochrome c family protein